MNKEFSYYNNIYGHEDLQKLVGSIDFLNLEKIWLDPYSPQNNFILNRLPNLNNKIILLLGNGVSVKEFFFLRSCHKLIYTDLSINAVSTMKMAFSQSQIYNDFKDKIFFEVIDATSLPFCNNSIDIVYGYAFVHHLNDIMLDRFLSEAYRVLKKDGQCIFFDNAYSPVWQLLKKTVFKPLQVYSHAKKGISPADLLATKKGGYTEQEVKTMSRKHGFSEFFFDRFSFFLWIWKRGSEKLLNNRIIMKKGEAFVTWLDNFLSRYKCFRKNQILLVWGFKK